MNEIDTTSSDQNEQQKPKSTMENLHDQINEAKDIMVSNIGQVLQRGENLDELENRSAELNITVKWTLLNL